jgi:Cu-processing system ATP-binding protein
MRLGRIQAAGTVQALREELDLPLRVQIALHPGSEEELRAALAGVPGCTLHLNAAQGLIHCQRGQKMAVLALLTARPHAVTDIQIREPSLEDVFLGYAEN